MISNVLTIAGSDSSGGAGIQADLKTFSALGVYGASVITALTAQNTLGVEAVEPVPAGFVATQLAAVLSDLEIAAIKIGMTGDEAVIGAIADALAEHADIPVVLDPVMVATSGDVLLAPGAEQALTARLLPVCSLLTPNAAEAARILDCDPAKSVGQMRHQAELLRDLGSAAVLLTGGDMTGHEALDVLVDDDGTVQYSAPRIDTPNTHGSGCTLSSAIAAKLALGHSLRGAVQQAKSFVTKAIEASDFLSVGAGRGPLNHLADQPKK